MTRDDARLTGDLPWTSDLNSAIRRRDEMPLAARSGPSRGRTVGDRPASVLGELRPASARVSRPLRSPTGLTITRTSTHHPNLYDERRFRPDLQWCQTVLQSAETAGRGQFSASWYQPGDYSLPHTDFVPSGRRRAPGALAWHLTKAWRPGWGGDFSRDPTHRDLAPSFNTLLLFMVSNARVHGVTTVNPHVRGRRLAVNGWWTGRGPTSGEAASLAEADQLSPLVEVA